MKFVNIWLITPSGMPACFGRSRFVMCRETIDWIAAWIEVPAVPDTWPVRGTGLNWARDWGDCGVKAVAGAVVEAVVEAVAEEAVAEEAVAEEAVAEEAVAEEEAVVKEAMSNAGSSAISSTAGRNAPSNGDGRDVIGEVVAHKSRPKTKFSSLSAHHSPTLFGLLGVDKKLSKRSARELSEPCAPCAWSPAGLFPGTWGDFFIAFRFFLFFFFFGFAMAFWKDDCMATACYFKQLQTASSASRKFARKLKRRAKV